MKKTNIILIILIVILTIALTIMTQLYLNMKKSSELGLESTLKSAEEIFELNKQVQELEKELNIYKNSSSISTVTNTTTSNKTVSTEPYIPDGMAVADPNDNSGIKAPDMKFNRSTENVTIEIVSNTACDTSVQILITDNNEDYYGWGTEFKVQKKVNSKWENLPYISDSVVWNSLAYVPNENNQLIQKLNIEAYYGKLDKGTYRVAKRVYDNGEYIDIFSNEFEIK